MSKKYLFLRDVLKDNNITLESICLKIGMIKQGFWQFLYCRADININKLEEIKDILKNEYNLNYTNEELLKVVY